MKANYAKQITAFQKAAYERGLWDGEAIMIDVVSVALYNCFGFGKQSPDKWDKLAAEIQRINDELMHPEAEEVSLGFEHMVAALVKIFGEDRREEIEKKYRNLLFK